MRVVIIGNGITGVSAAIRIRQLQPTWEINIISGESSYHYSRPAMMYIFMGHMTYEGTKPYADSFWGEQRIGLLKQWVTKIDIENKKLYLDTTRILPYDKLLIATGSKSNRFDWVGDHLNGVQGLYNLDDLKLLYRNVEKTKQAVIVGGGLIGIELGEMLYSRHIEVTFLIREKSYWNNLLPIEESTMINRVINERGISLVTGTNLKEIIGDRNGQVKAVRTEFEETLDCQLVGLTPGVSPNIDLIHSTPIASARGIQVDLSFRTNIPDVFAAGDCAEIFINDECPNLIQQVWYTGKKQGNIAGEVMAGKEVDYCPGIWYNSAKFFDLEYQTYGLVSNKPGPGERHLFWEHKSHRHSIRLVEKGDRIKGFIFMGIRARQEVCEKWIEEKRSLPYVINNLREIRFDPEFSVSYEKEIAQSLKEQI